jgi:hypothetical protein
MHECADYDVQTIDGEPNMQSKRAEVRIIDTTILSEDWYSLKKYTFEVQRHDGEWQRQNREAYDRGNGATVMLFRQVSDLLL